MKPFIARFATRSAARHIPALETLFRYDPRQEVAVLTDGDQLATDLTELSSVMTGTYITDARRDPTADESTDR